MSRADSQSRCLSSRCAWTSSSSSCPFGCSREVDVSFWFSAWFTTQGSQPQKSFGVGWRFDCSTSGSTCLEKELQSGVGQSAPFDDSAFRHQWKMVWPTEGKCLPLWILPETRRRTLETYQSNKRWRKCATDVHERNLCRFKADLQGWRSGIDFGPDRFCRCRSWWKSATFWPHCECMWPSPRL